MNINSYVTAAQGVSLKSEPRPSTLPYLIASDNKLLWHNISDQAHFQSLVDAARSRRGRWEGNGWQFRNASGCAAVLDHALELGFDNVYSSTDDYKAADDAAGQAIAQRSPELKVKAVCRGIWMVSQTPATDSMRSVLERAHCRVIVKGETSTLLCVVDTRAARSILKSAKAQGFRVALDGRCSAGERHAVHVTTKGWIVQVSIPIEAAPWAASLCLAPCTRVVDWPKVSYVCPQTQINDGYAIVEIPCAEWENLGARIICLGFTVKGDEPELAIPDTDSQASNFKHMPQGWESEAPNGYRLFQYQKAGVAFAASRQYRCLISDEMGVGKTAQAIACAQAAGARRVLIVVPANARYVWEREIRGWTGDDAPIQHLRSSLDCITLADGWLIATYDQLAARKETWNCADADEELEMLAWLKGADLFDSGLFEEDKEILSSSQIALIRTANQKLKIKIPDRAATLSTTPVLSEQRLQMWNFKMERLRGAIVVGIETWAPDMTIIDEAHRVKNPHAKRTKSLRRIAPNSQAVILLTGTPVRNNASEPAALLHLIDPKASAYLERNFDKASVRQVLHSLQIRRLKKDVLPDLPPQIRSSVALDVKIPVQYSLALEYARSCDVDSNKEDKSQERTSQKMLGAIAIVRRILGIAKVPAAFEFVRVVLEENERHCCVVFCAHHDVSDGLAKLLRGADKRVGIIDGRIEAAERSALIDQFQSARLDVLICGIGTASEGITLHRSDTVIFVEPDWVPGAIQQAEARIHRMGQTASTCWTYHLTTSNDCLAAVDNFDTVLWRALGSKLGIINDLLDERAALIEGVTEESKNFGTVQTAVIDQLLKGRVSALVGGNHEERGKARKASIAAGSKIAVAPVDFLAIAPVSAKNWPVEWTD